MRIIGGSAGSRRLRAPAGAGTRPTSDRVREALFNILGAPAADLAVLDLYAGAGTLGLEALSRGAATAVFVERAPAAVRCLRANIADLGFAGACRILPMDVQRALERLATDRARFGWVFADPPYAAPELDVVLERLGRGDLLAPDAVVVIEHDRRRAVPDACGMLAIDDRRVYGDTALALYRKTDEP